MNLLKKDKVLFLHGWCSDGSMKTLTIACMGYDVRTPRLSDWSFNMAVRTAFEALEEFNPDVVVGSSRGAAVALALKTNKPLVLLAPAWRQFGTIETVQNVNSIVIHSEKDAVVPYQDSVLLCEKNPGLVLWAKGDGHRLNDLEATQALTEALARLTKNLQEKTENAVDVFPRRGRLPLSM